MYGGISLKKIFVLDTNVLLHDPRSIFAFKEHEVIIPAVVLEEIDSKKRNPDEIGRNARGVSRLLDQLRERDHLHNGAHSNASGVIPNSSISSGCNLNPSILEREIKP